MVTRLHRLLAALDEGEPFRFVATLAWCAGELALQLPPDVRESYLDSLLLTDDQLRVRLSSLLETWLTEDAPKGSTDGD